ncbi:MAG: helix-turn-helix transcriptional regulator [Chitinophagales bacterium]
MRLDRLLAIVVLLVNRRTVKARELAELFEVSERTIHRDINAINQAGIPIVTYPGYRGGIGLAENYRIELSLLSLDDMVPILGALKGLQSAYPDDRLNQTIEKMQGLIPLARIPEYMDRSAHLVIDLSPWGSTPNQKEDINILKDAITNRHLVSFEYTTPEGAKSHRTVEPESLVLKTQNWYLYGYCRLRNDTRLFRISRIKELRILKDTFVKRENSPVNFSWEPTWTGKDDWVDVVLRFIPQLKSLVEEFFAGARTEVEEDGSIKIGLRLPVNEWMYGMILSYSDGVEVMEPPELRQRIIEKIDHLRKIYNSDTET